MTKSICTCPKQFGQSKIILGLQKDKALGSYVMKVIWNISTFKQFIFLLLSCIVQQLIVVLGLGRCRRGDSMSCSKFIILSLAILTSLFEALFESIPQLILQCTAVWRGVVKFEDVFRQVEKKQFCLMDVPSIRPHILQGLPLGPKLTTSPLKSF